MSFYYAPRKDRKNLGRLQSDVVHQMLYIRCCTSDAVHQLLVYADVDNLLCRNIITVKRNTEVLLNARKFGHGKFSFLGVFSKLQKETINFFMCFRQSIHMEQLGFH